MFYYGFHYTYFNITRTSAYLGNLEQHLSSSCVLPTAVKACALVVVFQMTSLCEDYIFLDHAGGVANSQLLLSVYTICFSNKLVKVHTTTIACYPCSETYSGACYNVSPLCVNISCSLHFYNLHCVCSVQGSWFVRQSVGSTPCLLGKAVDCNYIRGPNYLEVNSILSINLRFLCILFFL